MNKKLKVCFLCPKVYPLFVPECKGIFGGAEVDLYILGKTLAIDEGFDVSFVVGDYGQDDGVVSGGVRLFKSLRLGCNSITSILKIWNALKRGDSDIYFIKTMSTGVLLLWLFCFVYGKKYIIRTAHSTHCDGSFLKKHKLLAPFYKSAFRRASVVFTQNESDSQAIESVYSLDSKVLANGHELQSRKSGRSDYLLWVARSADFKNPRMFIELAKSLPEKRFVMICPAAFGDSNYDKLVMEAQTVGNLEFIKGVGFLQIQEYFNDAGVFVNTSESEGFANTFIQAAKSAVPILSYKVNPDSFIDKYNCGYCAGGDVVKLTELARQLSEDSSLNKELGDNAFEYVKGKHNILEIVEIYKQILREIVE